LGLSGDRGSFLSSHFPNKIGGEKMRKKFLVLVLILLGGCGYSGNGSQDSPVKAKPMIIESTDGSRYNCQGIDALSYGGYTSVSVFDCEKIKD
jgi:hypothetical protein